MTVARVSLFACRHQVWFCMGQVWFCKDCTAVCSRHRWAQLCYSSRGDPSTQATNSLAHDDVKLMLHLRAHTGRDGGRQLVGCALEGIDQLPELTHQRIPGFLLTSLLVLQVGLQLLNICKKVAIIQIRLEFGFMAWRFAHSWCFAHHSGFPTVLKL